MSEHSGVAGLRRREFLKVLGATGATAAAVGCSSKRVEKLIPYLVQPDETVPGVSDYYASTCRECAAECGILMETRDGRTFKLEGNPDHPLNKGALCARGQAAVQGLYNPDRYQQPMVRQGDRLVPTTWDKALALFQQKLGEAQSGGRAANGVFINRHESGSFNAFLDAWLAGYGLPPHLSWHPLAPLGAITANRQTYGVAWPSLDFGAARLIVSVAADFLDGWGALVPQQLSFADARAKLEGAPRFIYIGPRRSLTGLNADEWISCKPVSALAIVNALSGTGSLEDAAQRSGAPLEKLQRLAQALQQTKPSLVLAGGTSAHGTELALAVNALNQRLGNVGATVLPSQPLTSFEGLASDADIAEAIERMRAGQVPIALFRGVNPVYQFPKSARVAEALSKVAFKVCFSSYADETSALCDLVLPDHHPIESWGDAQSIAGTTSMQQPGMDPVYDTRQTADVLLAVAKGNPRLATAFAAPNYRTWLIDHFPGGVNAFTAAITTGLSTASAAARPVGAPRAPTPRTPPAPPAATHPAIDIEQTNGEFYLVVYASPTLGDGSGANKPWLQELPDPVTKICWQSWIEIAPETATRLAIDSGDVLTVETPQGKVSAPAYVYPGIRPDTLAIALGQGHTAYGMYATNVGVNAGDVLPMSFDARSGALAITTTKVKLTKTGDFVPLVTTEGSARQHGRGIARALTVTELGRLHVSSGAENAGGVAPQGSAGSEQARPGTAREGNAPEGEKEQLPGDASHDFLPGLRAPVAQDAQGGLPSDDNLKGMYDPNHWSGMARRRWAMTIDLARCTGCSACVTACYAENNIPTVGAVYQTHQTASYDGVPGGNILRGREMNWIRLERYWEGDESSPDVEARFVPMLCQHCGNAPCEPVCPVYATYHSPDGLNVQVYNRCVGTRYCSNNCPYKVRYFNWFGYGEPNRPQYAWPGRMSWQLNPDVTVRQKGVMEKCSFCVQRIREAEHRARAENRALEPEEFTTSCAQACPSRAIVFGDAADPAWSVAKLAYDRRAYHVFEELNTFTAVVYLQKVNHPAEAGA